MAVAGQVSVKYTADTAEYSAGTERVKRANKEVEDAATQVGKTNGSAFLSMTHAVKDFNSVLKSTGIAATLKLVAGGGALGMFSHVLDRVAESAANYRKYMEEGMTAHMAFVQSTYDLPLVGAFQKMLDAIGGKMNDKEILEAQSEIFKEGIADANKMYDVIAQRDSQRFKNAQLSSKFYDQEAEQHKLAVETVKEEMDIRAAAHTEELKYATERQRLEEQLEDLATALTHQFTIRGDMSLIKMLTTRIQQTKDLLDVTRQLHGEQERESMLAAKKVNDLANRAFLDDMLKSMRGGAHAFLGGAVKWFGELEGKAGKFIENYQEGTRKIADAEKELKDSMIERLEAAGALGNDEARRAAERLRIEERMVEERAKLQKIATDKDIPQNLRDAAEEQLKNLPGFQKLLEMQIQSSVAHPSATPQLSAQFSTNSNGIPQQTLAELKKQTEIQKKIAEAPAPKVVSIGP
jgi:hypothetical protein